jgi:hypothetical protein
MSKTTARPRKMYASECYLRTKGKLPLSPKRVVPCMCEVLVFDASAAAHAERVEQVAKALHKCAWPKSYKYDEFSRKFYTKQATAALAALSKDL